MKKTFQIFPTRYTWFDYVASDDPSGSGSSGHFRLVLRAGPNTAVLSSALAGDI